MQLDASFRVHRFDSLSYVGRVVTVRSAWLILKLHIAVQSAACLRQQQMQSSTVCRGVKGDELAALVELLEAAEARSSCTVRHFVIIIPTTLRIFCPSCNKRTP